MTGSGAFDPRLTPARPDLAAEYLRGKVDAARYTEGRTEYIVAGLADMRGEPSPGASLTTQALRGETVQVYEVDEGWAWCRLLDDGYVGYIPAAALAPLEGPASHKVTVLSTFLYPGPSMKLPISETLPLNAKLQVSGMEGDFARIGQEGFVWAGHIEPLSVIAQDTTAAAEQFIGAPYLWGGKSIHGIDCSGLVQTALAAAGIAAPRDTDMQEAALGQPLVANEEAARPVTQWNCRLQRGDLVFWRGHVGIMRDANNLLHANGYHMLVASEPLTGAVERIAANSFGAVTSVRRL